jgi:hypothetical protein
MMEAVRNAETSVYFHETTRRYIPEICHLHIRRRENLKSHVVFIIAITVVILNRHIFVEPINDRYRGLAVY